MSEESKRDAESIKRFFKTVEQAAHDIGQGSGAKLGDKELLTKIQKVKESAGEVSKHIEKKSG